MAKNELMMALDNELQKVEVALPSGFNRERFMGEAYSLLYDNEQLRKFPDKNAIYMGLLKGAYLGLSFANKEAYLVTYGSKLNFQTSYLGEIKFVKKYSQRPIKDIYAKIVRKGDEFVEKIVDGHPSVDFKPIPFNGEEVVGVFAVCLFEDGGMVYETMSKEDVESTRRNYSKAANSPAWKNSWDEMAKKTCLRRLTKHLQTDFESIEAQKAWEDGGDADFSKKVRREVPTDTEKDVFSIEPESVTDSEEVITATASEVTD